MQKLKIKTTFTEPLLGMSPGDSELLKTHISSMAPELAKAAEEIEASEVANEVDKRSTKFPIDSTGIFAWDYQWRGYFKDQFRTLIEIGQAGAMSKWTVSRAVDTMLFTSPRRIYICRDGKPITKPDGSLSRPLRATTLQGDRIAIAQSDMVHPGATMEFEISFFTTPEKSKSKQSITKDLILLALGLGVHKGWGQWRGGGYGRFTFECAEVGEAG